MAAARLAFLSRANTVEEYNGRLAFLELTRIPTHADIKEVCKLRVLTRWMAGSNNRFNHKTATGRPDLSRTYPASAIKQDYDRTVAELRQTIGRFELAGLLAIARNTEFTENEKALGMLTYRLISGLPTKEPTGIDGNGFVLMEYVALAARQAGDEKVEAAMFGQ